MAIRTVAFTMRSQTKEQRALRGKTPFAEAMRTLTRLSSSYRRCYWKSGSEMLFPLLYGHMTFASHRCWTVYVKKAVFLAAQAWRTMYGRSVRHAALAAGGGETIRYIRPGMDPYPLIGWTRHDEDGAVYFKGPNGEICDSEASAFDMLMANKRQGTGERDAAQTLTFLQKFLNATADEQRIKRPRISGQGVAELAQKPYGSMRTYGSPFPEL